MQLTIPSHSLISGDYFAYPAISRSSLLKWLKSPLHFFHQGEGEETEAMKRGTLFHECLLEPRKFDENYVRFEKPVPGSTMNKAENKAAWNEILEQGKQPIQGTVYDNAKEMTKAVIGHPTMAKAFLTLGKSEIALKWKHPSGEVLKIKVDRLTCNERGIITAWDAKKTQDASERGFVRACSTYKLELQAAFYSLVLRQLFGDQYRNFVFVMVEEQPPHGVGAYYLDSENTQKIEAFIDQEIWKIREARKAKRHWSYSDPSVSQGIQRVDLPHYIINQYESASSTAG